MSRTFHGIICPSHEKLLWASDSWPHYAGVHAGLDEAPSSQSSLTHAGLQDTLQHNAKLSPVRKVQFQGIHFLEPITQSLQHLCQGSAQSFQATYTVVTAYVIKLSICTSLNDGHRHGWNVALCKATPSLPSSLCKPALAFDAGRNSSRHWPIRR